MLTSGNLAYSECITGINVKFTHSSTSLSLCFFSLHTQVHTTILQSIETESKTAKTPGIIINLKLKLSSLELSLE